MAVNSASLFVGALLFAALVHPCFAQIDESPYRASAMVKRYHKYTFELTGSYFQTLAMNTALPVLIVGVICFFVVAIWTCCRCCCKNCRVKEETSTHRFRLFVFIMIILITLTCVGILIYGFRADQTQSDALNSVPKLVDNVVAWKDQSTLALRNLINVTNLTIADVNTLLNSGICDGGIDCSEATVVRDRCQDIVTNADTILQNVGNVQLDSIRSNLSKNVQTVDDYRHLGMIAVLAVLFGTICLQAIIALMDSRCPPKYQVREYFIGNCLTVLLTLCIILLILIIWFLAALLLFTSVLFADLCITPAATIIRVSKITDPYTIYFLTCDQDPTMVSPLASQLSAIDSARNLTRESLTALNVTAQACTGSVNCDPFRTSVNNIGQRAEAVFVAVGVPDETGNANTGILAQFSCKSLNGKFQAVLHVVCGDFFLSMAQTFEVIIAFASLYVLLQVFVGLSADRSDDDSSTVRPTIYGYGDNGDVEMKPPSYTNSTSAGSGHVMYGGNSQNI